jgi:predicted DNA-binding transcriptional regulator AlpA
MNNLYTVLEFCRMHQISKAMFYKLRKVGNAPNIIKIGRLTRISDESIGQWRKIMESKCSRIER